MSITTSLSRNSMSDSWSHEEVEAVITDYFDMLEKEVRGENFNKAERNRQLQQILQNRTRGSIEKKHQNISAILIELGCPYIDGYKPLSNYQELLYSRVLARLSHATTLSETVARAVEAQVESLPSVSNILLIHVDPPRRDAAISSYAVKEGPPRRPIRRNYLELEARNQSLGRAGEELVLRYEHERLWQSGQRKLADRIEHSSKIVGDHLGYDIHSFEADGRDRLIEVKTTRYGALTPFFASRNEIDFSANRNSEYQLYRLFNFRAHPKLFVLQGSLYKSCDLEPINFSAIPK